MNVSIGKHWEKFVEALVKSGRYGSGSEVIRQGLRLVEEQEEELHALRTRIGDSITRAGSHSDDEIGRAIEEHLSRPRAAAE